MHLEITDESNYVSPDCQNLLNRFLGREVEYHGHPDQLPPVKQVDQTPAGPGVVALYVASDSIYKRMGIECYDEERDATTYAGNLPVIAHPPCRNWGKLKGFAKGDDAHLAFIALDQVRTHGGVLEHPVGSTFFKAAGIPVPEEFGVFGDWDEFGGAVIKLRQYDLGHRGYKGTYFYVFGTLALPALWERMDDNPIKVQNMCQRERLATPVGVAHWLVKTAQACAPAQTFEALLRQHGVN